MKKCIFLLLTLGVMTLTLGGCFRKSIESAPPAKKPVAQEQVAQAEEPGLISETHSVGGSEPPVIEETHDKTASAPQVIDESSDLPPAEGDGPIEVEAAVRETDRPDIGGADLAEEPMPEPEPVTEAAEQVETAEADPQAVEAFEPVADPEDEQVMDMAEPTAETASVEMPNAAETGDYYVQVGAFSDLENANKVLAGLLSDGYKGSMLVKTDTGMYRVRAGAFADTDAASQALEALKADYPNGFVLKAE